MGWACAQRGLRGAFRGEVIVCWQPTRSRPKHGAAFKRQKEKPRLLSRSSSFRVLLGERREHSLCEPRSCSGKGWARRGSGHRRPAHVSPQPAAARRSAGAAAGSAHAASGGRALRAGAGARTRPRLCCDGACQVQRRAGVTGAVGLAPFGNVRLRGGAREASPAPGREPQDGRRRVPDQLDCRRCPCARDRAAAGKGRLAGLVLAVVRRDVGRGGGLSSVHTLQAVAGAARAALAAFATLLILLAAGLTIRRT